MRSLSDVLNVSLNMIRKPVQLEKAMVTRISRYYEEEVECMNEGLYKKVM
jgi:hypothetical protein